MTRFLDITDMDDHELDTVFSSYAEASAAMDFEPFALTAEEIAAFTEDEPDGDDDGPKGPGLVLSPEAQAVYSEAYAEAVATIQAAEAAGVTGKALELRVIVEMMAAAGRLFAWQEVNEPDVHAAGTVQPQKARQEPVPVQHKPKSLTEARLLRALDLADARHEAAMERARAQKKAACTEAQTA